MTTYETRTEPIEETLAKQVIFTTEKPNYQLRLLNKSKEVDLQQKLYTYDVYLPEDIIKNYNIVGGQEKDV